METVGNMDTMDTMDIMDAVGTEETMGRVEECLEERSGERIKVDERIKVLVVDDHELLRGAIRGAIEKEVDMVVVGQASTASEALEGIAPALQAGLGSSPDIILAGAGLDGLDRLIGAVRERAPGVACIVHGLGGGEAAIEAIRAGARGCVSKVSGMAELLEAVRAVAGGGCFVSPGLLAEVLEEFHRSPGLAGSGKQVGPGAEPGGQGKPGAPLQPLKRVIEQTPRARGLSGAYASRSEVAAAALIKSCNGARGDGGDVGEGESRIDALTPREMEVLDLLSSGGTNRDIARTLCVSEKTVKNHVTSILHKLHVRSRTQAAVLAVRARSGGGGRSGTVVRTGDRVKVGDGLAAGDRTGGWKVEKGC